MTSRYSVLIVGGGTAGVTVAARLRRAGIRDVAVVEPSGDHWYQPLWTLVGGGVVPLERTRRDEASVMPKGTTWLRDAVVAFEPEAHRVTLRSGSAVEYDQLVVCPGIQLDWHKIEGLEDNLGKHGIVSNYRPDLAPLTWEAIRKQAPVLVANLLAHRLGEPLGASYDGYTSCPVITGYGRLVLAEFDYDGKPKETFPFNQARERWSMYQLKAHVLPQLYWHGMLKGLA